MAHSKEGDVGEQKLESKYTKAASRAEPNPQDGVKDCSILFTEPNGSETRVGLTRRGREPPASRATYIRNCRPKQ